MKNIKFPNWLHRLPLLLHAPILALSLIIAVSPLIMAVPVRADVLEGFDPPPYYPGYYFLFEDEFGRVYVEQFNFMPSLGKNACALVWNSDFTLDLYICSGFSVDGDVVSSGSGFFYKGLEPRIVGEDTFFDFGSSNICSSGVRDFTLPFVYAFYGEPVNGALAIPLPVVAPGGPGVLSVFSGVGSWLSGAVLNISTMFWTAESGMTVLGYLAVASLAMAVILLIFYLIAGWLKFH